MKYLRIALNRRDIPDLPEPFLYIEEAASLGARNPDDFRNKFRIFLDDLGHLKYLDHIRFESTDRLSNEDRLRLERYQTVAKQVIHDLNFALGRYEDSLAGIQNIFQNVGTMLTRPDVSDISIRKPFDALVIAAGPSLEREFDQLRSLQNRVLLVCVDAVLKALLKNGVCPHFVVATERCDHSLPFFENLPTDLSTTFIGQPTVPPRLFASFPGRIATIFKYTGTFLWFGWKRPTFWAASSSAHSCYRICALMGARRIALVGQDLAYHPETFQSHSDLTVHPEWSQPTTFEERVRSANALYAEGNTISRVPTEPVWQMFGHEYSLIVRETKIPTINTSFFGLKLEGIPYLPLSEWASEVSSTQIEIKVPLSNPRLKQELKLLRAKRNDAIQSLSQLRKRLSNDISAHSVKALYSELLKYPHVLEIVLELVLRDFVKTENACFNATEEEASISRMLFLNRLQKALDDILECLEAKLDLTPFDSE